MTVILMFINTSIKQYTDLTLESISFSSLFSKNHTTTIFYSLQKIEYCHKQTCNFQRCSGLFSQVHNADKQRLHCILEAYSQTQCITELVEANNVLRRATTYRALKPIVLVFLFGGLILFFAVFIWVEEKRSIIDRNFPTILRRYSHQWHEYHHCMTSLWILSNWIVLMVEISSVDIDLTIWVLYPSFYGH